MPLGITSVLSVFLLAGIHLFHDNSHYFLPDLKIEYVLPAVLYIVAIIFFSVALSVIKYEYLCLMSVFTVALLPRLLLILFFETQLYPFSDFLWSWEVASGVREGSSYVAHLPFPAYNVWAWFEYLLTSIFPKSYLSVLITNAVIDSLTALCITVLTGMLVNEKRVSIIAGVLYALFPSSIIYCTIGTPDIIAIMFNLVGIIHLIKAYRAVSNQLFGYLLAAGIAFGISSSFKSFSIVIILAFLITELMYHRRKGCLFGLLVEGLVLLLPFFIVKSLILGAVSIWLGTDLNQYSSGVLYHQLLVGLNTEGEGQIHLGTLSRGFWSTFLENGYDSAAAGDYAKKILFENWSRHKSDIPQLLEQKIVWAWQDDLIPIHYFLNLMGVDGTIHHRIYETIKNVVPTISQVMYIAICSFGIATVVDDFRQNDTSREGIFIKLIIFGFFMLLLIIEAQSRYKCLIVPLICILAAGSIKRSIDIICIASTRIKEKHWKRVYLLRWR